MNGQRCAVQNTYIWTYRYVHYKNIYHEILLSIKNNEIMLSAAIFIDLEIILLSEIRQKDTHNTTYM